MFEIFWDTLLIKKRKNASYIPGYYCPGIYVINNIDLAQWNLNDP